jgi:hypothetical protein
VCTTNHSCQNGACKCSCNNFCLLATPCCNSDNSCGCQGLLTSCH